ncbi:hypothetical protein YOLOSWAG_28 [Erwinia phage vB_EamM_Yoloswag]|uniref:Uncharacterized protein n=1 Tax=Erwinia phage vB_EamM_Yoloswag TaxID=1958956 RepID=A0A1S6L2W8_9CAUD|nr:hypothetical protein HOR66_gp028 [Erwinia phage vB_EamM_Yoloswag]AQT28513.1 hypothetical protein YOLOSWAG_28 [Erwinia phage vB_EamM_Yoloswag]
MDNTIQPEDEINGFQVTDKASDLFRYAFYLKTLNFELPTSWWQSHIVANADEVLERGLLVEGPVVLAHDVSIFDGWKTVCRNSRDYCDAAFAGLLDMYDRFERVLEHTSRMTNDFEYEFNLPQDQQWLNRNAVLFFERARLLIVVRNNTLDSWQIGVSPTVRSWIYRKHNMLPKKSFAEWQNLYASQRTLGGLDKQQIAACATQYLAVNFPDKFGGGL